MIRSILVPTDFSDNALKAAHYAAEIAKKNGCKVYVLHVNELVIDGYRSSPFANNYEQEKENELAYLNKNLRADFPNVKFDMLLELGPVTETILKVTQERKADLIVMGTKGATGLRQTFIGTQTVGVVARSSVPVLSVPDNYSGGIPDAILYATNTFEKDGKLLKPVIELARIFNAKVHVVLFHDIAEGSTLDDAEGLENYLVYLRTAYPDTTFSGELLEGDNLQSALDIYHASHKTDMAAMITYPKSFWDRLFKRSMTQKVVYDSSVPVLAIPAE